MRSCEVDQGPMKGITGRITLNGNEGVVLTRHSCVLNGEVSRLARIFKQVCAFYGLGILFLGCCPAAHAQVEPGIRAVVLPVVEGRDIRFNHVFFGKGPAHSRAHSILQDQQGFLWLATADRLQRYDGYDVREYPPGPNDSNVYSRVLIKDRSGTLWAARDRGLGLDNVPFGSLDRYDPATGTFTPFTPHDPWFESPVSDITQDREGKLWFATSKGLIQMDPASGRTLLYQHRADDPASLTGNLVRSVLEARDGTLWVATSKGLDLFDPHSAKVLQRIPLPEDVLALHRAAVVRSRLCEDRDGVLWVIFSQGYGLARVDRKAGKLIFYSLDGAGTDDPSRSGARAIRQDRNGALWIGTSSSGILKLEPDRTRFTRYRNNPGDPESLSGDEVLDLFEDREGNMWVGTNDAGVDRFPTHPLPFRRYRHEEGNPNSLDTNYTTTVFEDSRGILWVGSRRALGALDRKTGRMTFYRKSGGPGGLSDAWVYSVAEDRSGYLWFGTLNGGLNRFDRRTGKFRAFRHHPADPHSIIDNQVYKLLVDHNGGVWAGTNTGLSRFDAETERFQTYLNGLRIRDIAEDANGQLWIAARATGLVRFDPATGHSATHRLSSDKAGTVTVDHTGTLWVGTENGLHRFDPATQNVTAYYDSDGLADNSVSHIMEDDRGELWVSTHNGLSRFNPRLKTFKNYYVSDGLSGNEFYDSSSSFKSPGGEMFFSANGGLTSFFPREIVDEPTIAPVVITGFKIFGRESALRKTLSHSQNILTFEFSALSFISPERNRYRYRLEPIENEWNESQGDRRSITYALSPGDYIFRVQGSNSRDVWNEQGATVRFEISQPWWNRWPFRTLVIISVLMSVGYAYYRHLQRIKRQFNIRLEERVGERVRIARELHDTLLQTVQGLMLRLQVVDEMLPPGKAKEELEETLEVGDQAIIEGRNTVGDLRKPLATNDLARSVRTLGDELASGNSAAFRLVVEGPARELHPIVRDELYRIAREALRNAFAHAKAKHIEAEITYEDRLLRLRIRDDGEGIPTEILEEGRSGHFGLGGMRERAKQIGSKLTIWSGAGAGSEIEVSVAGSVAYSKPPARSGFWRSRKHFWGSPKKKVG